MRTIKFRAWDKKMNCFEYLDDMPSSGDLFLNLHGVLCMVTEWSGYSGGGVNFDDVSDEYELMQFTGLLDKNGKEIYEGDIVRDREYGRQYTVKWNQLHCCFGLFKNNAFVSELIGNAFIEVGDITESSYLVIGNIHENPELTK